MLDIAEKGVSKIEKGLYKMFQYLYEKPWETNSKIIKLMYDPQIRE